MHATLDEAVRAAKASAGLDPETAHPPVEFIDHLAAEWHGPFWERQLDRVVTDTLGSDEVPL